MITPRPELALRLVGLVTSLAEESLPRTRRLVDADGVAGWYRLILAATAGNVREVRSAFTHTPQYGERLVVMLEAFHWCRPCAVDSRNADGVHACDILADGETICACIECN